MQKRIDVETYCAAFTAWARVSRSIDEQSLVERACAHLRANFAGVHPIQDLCEGLGQWSFSQPEKRLGGLSTEVAKSNLLLRMIYGGEPLRTRPCPIHEGRWSGCKPDPCPAGCSVGLDITGWLPEES